MQTPAGMFTGPTAIALVLVETIAPFVGYEGDYNRQAHRRKHENEDSAAQGLNKAGG